ncbi:histidine kinase [Candidatus Magnetomorum sp. HK-1]|nr:histidine kinase [Candidatus Magnetomorum sp. HK-1]
MHKKHILIVDDEKNILIGLSIILKKAGYKISTANNGVQALNILNEFNNTSESIDLLLTDIEMPDMTGMELIDVLSKNNISVPKLVISGYGDKEMLVELMKKGCDDYIDKPFESHELLGAITRIFQKIEKKQEIAQKHEQKKNIEKMEFDRMLESYKHNYEKLKSEMDSAVGAYQDLINFDMNTCNIPVAYHSQTYSNLGGDLLDIRNTSSGIDILIADVAGHDMGASFHTVLIKAFFDENCRTGNDGQSFFQILNKQLLDNGKNERMVTGIFLRLDLNKMEANFVSAGHPPPIYISKHNQELVNIDVKGPVLGMFDEPSYITRTLPVIKGDRILLYTDGLNECVFLDEKTGKRKKLTINGLNNIVLKHKNHFLRQMVKNIWTDVLDYCSYKHSDDMMLMGMEIP